MTPYAAPGGDDVGGDLALGAGLDGDVEEARPGDLDRGDALGRLEPLPATSSAKAARVGARPSWPSCSATLVA